MTWAHSRGQKGRKRRRKLAPTPVFKLEVVHLFIDPDKPKNIKISVNSSGEVLGGSSVTLTCSCDANPPVQTYTWYKENITSSKSSGESYTITISSEDSLGYYCQAGNTGVTNSSVVMITRQVGYHMIFNAVLYILFRNN